MNTQDTQRYTPDRITHYEVTPIEEVGHYYQYNIYAIYDDGMRYRVCVIRNEKYKGLQMFRLLHEEHVSFYCGLIP